MYSARLAQTVDFDGLRFPEGTRFKRARVRSARFAETCSEPIRFAQGKLREESQTLNNRRLRQPRVSRLAYIAKGAMYAPPTSRAWRRTFNRA